MVVKLEKGFSRYSKHNASIIYGSKEKTRVSQEAETVSARIEKERRFPIQFYTGNETI